jgi:endonuclease III
MSKPRSPAGRAALIHARLAKEYDAHCELVHSNAFELLVATILSAQCTDVRVNATTPALFDYYPDPSAMASAELAHLEELVCSTGFYRNKAKNLSRMANQLLDSHNGEVPESRKKLVELAGVGRKTANVIRSVAFGLPGLPVDTHVGRLARRLSLTDEEDPERVEMVLNPLIPKKERGEFSLRLILHGRQVCFARNPSCDVCLLNDFCPSAFMV